MKKKLLVLLIAAIPALMPNLASAIAIDTGDLIFRSLLAPQELIHTGIDW